MGSVYVNVLILAEVCCLNVYHNHKTYRVYILIIRRTRPQLEETKKNALNPTKRSNLERCYQIGVYPGPVLMQVVDEHLGMKGASFRNCGKAMPQRWWLQGGLRHRSTTTRFTMKCSRNGLFPSICCRRSRMSTLNDPAYARKFTIISGRGQCTYVVQMRGLMYDQECLRRAR